MSYTDTVYYVSSTLNATDWSIYPSCIMVIMVLHIGPQHVATLQGRFRQFDFCNGNHPAAPRNRRPQSSPPHSSNFQKGETSPGCQGGRGVPRRAHGFPTVQDLVKRKNNYYIDYIIHPLKTTSLGGSFMEPHIISTCQDSLLFMNQASEASASA